MQENFKRKRGECGIRKVRREHWRREHDILKHSVRNREDIYFYFNMSYPTTMSRNAVKMVNLN